MKIFQEWSHGTALTNGQNLVVNYPAPLSGQTVFDASYCNKLTWCIHTERAATFTVEGSTTIGFGVTTVLHTVGVLAGVVSTPYNLGAPMNQLGYVVVNMPFIRLRLQDTSAGAHAFTVFYAKCWMD